MAGLNGTVQLPHQFKPSKQHNAKRRDRSSEDESSSGHTYSFHPTWIRNGTKHSWRILLFASGLALKTVLIQSQFLYNFYNVFRATSFLAFSMHAIASGL